MNWFIFFLFLLISRNYSQAIPITSLTEFFTSTLPNGPADDAELTRMMTLCASDTRCKRFSGMSLDGLISVDQFTQMLTLAPFTQNPPAFNNGIYDVLVGNTDVSAANDEIMILRMVYAFSHIAGACAPIEIVKIVNGVVTCQPNPRANFINPDTYNYVLMLSAILTVIAEFLFLAINAYAVYKLLGAISQTQPKNVYSSIN